MKKLIPMLSLLMLILASCGKNNGTYISGIPYQETEKGQWSMISPDGEVLFSDEFKERPTVAKEGLFMVKNKEGLWEIYKADKKPKKIGTEYVSAALFCNGKAVVCERNKHISIIDTDGKTVKTIDKIDGKEVGEVHRFSEGYAIYKAGDYYGVIDDDARPVIPAEYCTISDCSDGKFIAVNKKYEKEYKADSTSVIKYTVLNTKGEKLFELNGATYCRVGSFCNGLLPVCVKKEGNEMWGLINEKQETVVKPVEKMKGIGDLRDDMFTYYNGEGWGLMNTKGETLIRAKYDWLRFDGNSRLLAYTKDKGDKVSCKFIDKDDNQIGKDSYLEASTFEQTDGKHALVKVNDKLWSLINDKGEQLEKLPDMVNVSTADGDYIVESDYVDIAKVLDNLKVTQDGMDGVTFSSSPKEVVQKLAQYRGVGDAKHPGTTAYWYDYMSTFSYGRNACNVWAMTEINFSGNMSKQTFRTKQVIDYTFGDWYWYHNEKIPTGYVWNPVKIQSFKLSFSNDGIMRGKLRMTLKEIAKRLKNTGKVVKENDGAIVVELNNKKTAFAYLKPKEVVLVWGNIGSPQSINIDKYADAKEDLTGNGDYMDEPDSDYAAVDTMAVDTMEY